MSNIQSRWTEAIELFRTALQRWQKSKNDAILLAALTKTYETVFEYTWKIFKIAADEAGQEVYSPRDSIKAAAQLKLIDSPELWNEFLNARNLSVHDYLGVSDIDFEKTLKQFDAALNKLGK